MARPMTTARGGPNKATPRGESTDLAERLRNEISLRTLRGHVDRADADFLLVDVRDAEAYRVEHIVGAVNVHADEIVEALEAEFPGERNVVVCGEDGTDPLAKECAERLTEAGFTARVLQGGFSSWRDEGHPVEQGDPYEADDY